MTPERRLLPDFRLLERPTTRCSQVVDAGLVETDLHRRQYRTRLCAVAFPRATRAERSQCSTSIGFIRSVQVSASRRTGADVPADDQERQEALRGPRQGPQGEAVLTSRADLRDHLYRRIVVLRYTVSCSLCSGCHRVSLRHHEAVVSIRCIFIMPSCSPASQRVSVPAACHLVPEIACPPATPLRLVPFARSSLNRQGWCAMLWLHTLPRPRRDDEVSHGLDLRYAPAIDATPLDAAFRVTGASLVAQQVPPRISSLASLYSQHPHLLRRRVARSSFA